MIHGVRVSGTAKATKREAQRELDKEIARHLSKPHGSELPLADYAYECLNGPYQEGPDKLAPSAWILEEMIYRTRIETSNLGTMPLCNIEPEHISAWQASLNISPSSVNRYVQFLRKLLNRAENEGLILRSPCRGVKNLKVEEPIVIILTEEEEKDLFALSMTERTRLGIRLMLHGLRRSETCGLRHEDFDGEGINIWRQHQDLKGKRMTRALKTKASYNWVPVDNELRAILGAKKEGFVLAQRNGEPMSPNELYRDFRDAIKGTKFMAMRTQDGRIASLAPHDLRATFAMRLIEKGNDPRTVAEMTRHSVEMLIKVYNRSRRELKLKALQSIRPTHPDFNPAEAIQIQ